MIFTITRTSGLDEVQPCEEATPYVVTYLERYKFRTPKEFDESLGISRGKWLDKGTNHRIIGGYIARDNGTRKCWAVEINSLEDLLAFYRKYGRLVINVNYWDEETPNIEIYDTWRE